LRVIQGFDLDHWFETTHPCALSVHEETNLFRPSFGVTVRSNMVGLPTFDPLDTTHTPVEKQAVDVVVTDFQEVHTHTVRQVSTDDAPRPPGKNNNRAVPLTEEVCGPQVLHLILHSVQQGRGERRSLQHGGILAI